MQKNKGNTNQAAESEDTAVNKENGGAVPSDNENTVKNDNCCCQNQDEEISKLRESLNEKSKQYDELFAMLQRTAAEFDNYKKRTVKEKELLYMEASAEVMASFLPVADNLERALAASAQDEGQSLREGLQMVLRQLKEVMGKFGVAEIEAVGKEFDPQLHNAVMHVEDENFGHNIVAEEFLKGYIYKDKVLRHSVVKVAN